MMEKEIIYSSFLVRIWHIANTDNANRIADRVYQVESVQSGETWKVKSLEALFILLQELTRVSQD